MKSLIIFITAAVIVAAVAFLKIECEVCEGNGNLDGSRTVVESCSACGGSGKVNASVKGSLSGKADKKLGSGTRSCFKCKGKGQVAKDVPRGECADCNGAGIVRLYSRYF